MALPDTLSGTTLCSNHKCPPIQVGGSTYLVLLDSTDKSLIEVWKNTNPGTDTWSEQDSSNKPTTSGTYNVEAIACVLAGTNIHIVSMTGNGTTAVNDVDYHVFNTSTDTWSIADENIENNLDVDLTTASNMGVSICVRSDGDVIAFYAGNSDKIMGIDYTRIDYNIRVSGTWGGATALDDAGEVSYKFPIAVLGASDKSHVAYVDVTNADIHHKSLTSGDSLSSAEVVNDNTIDSSRYPSIAYNDNSGNEEIHITWNRSSDDDIYISTITNDGTPGAETRASDSAYNVANALTVSNINTNGTDLYLLWSDNAADLYISEDTGSGWGNHTSIYTGTVDAFSSSIFVNDSGDTVLGYIYLDSSTTYYDEYVIASGGITVNLGFISSGTTLYAPSYNKDLSLTFISSASSVYALTVSRDLALTFINSTTTLYPVSYDRSLDLGFIASSSALYSPALAKDILLGAIASSSTLYSVAIERLISLGFISSGGVLYTPTIEKSLTLGTIASSSVVYTLTASTTGGIDVNLTFIASSSALYSPTIEKSVDLSAITSVSSVYTLSVEKNVNLGVIASGTSVHTLNLEKLVPIGFISSTSNPYAVTISRDVLINFISSASAVYSVENQKQIDLTFINSSSLVHSLTLTKDFALGFVSSGTNVYALSVERLIDLGFISASSNLYNPTLTKSLDLTFISGSTVIYPVAIGGNITVNLTFIAGTSLLYALSVEKSYDLGFISSVSSLYSPEIQKSLNLSAIPSGSMLYTIDPQKKIDLNHILNSSVLYGLEAQKAINLGFISGVSAVYAVEIQGQIILLTIPVDLYRSIDPANIEKQVLVNLYQSVDSTDIEQQSEVNVYQNIDPANLP